MAMHTKKIEDIEVAVMVVERSHREIETTVLRNEVPRLGKFVGFGENFDVDGAELDRKSTRLNSSHS